MRGPGFEPLTFRLEKITTPRLVDAKGRLLPTVRAVHISEAEEATQAQHVRRDEDRVLASLLAEPDRSVAKIARACGWLLQNGDPYKSRVQRALERLGKESPKLISKARGQHVATEPGKEAARKAALRVEK
jgi:hypothetical protein